jgi:MYXO-CTERM domain-containing protein
MTGCVYYDGGFDNCPDGSTCNEKNGTIGSCVEIVVDGGPLDMDSGSVDAGGGGGADASVTGSSDSGGGPVSEDDGGPVADAALADGNTTTTPLFDDSGDLRGGGCACGAVPDGGSGLGGGALALVGLAGLARRRRKRPLTE